MGPHPRPTEPQAAPRCRDPAHQHIGQALRCQGQGRIGTVTRLQMPHCHPCPESRHRVKTPSGERRVVNASGLVALSGRYVSVGQALAGRRVTLCLDGDLEHASSPTASWSVPCPRPSHRPCAVACTACALSARSADHVQPAAHTAAGLGPRCHPGRRTDRARRLRPRAHPGRHRSPRDRAPRL